MISLSQIFMSQLQVGSLTRVATCAVILTVGTWLPTGLLWVSLEQLPILIHARPSFKGEIHKHNRGRWRHVYTSFTCQCRVITWFWWTVVLVLATCVEVTHLLWKWEQGYGKDVLFLIPLYLLICTTALVAQASTSKIDPSFFDKQTILV